MTHNNKKIEMFILFNMQIIFHLYHTLKNTILYKKCTLENKPMPLL